MPVQPNNPFSEKDYHDLSNQLEELGRISTEIQQAALAGCAVGDRDKLCSQAIAALQQIKRTYWPDRP